MSIQRRCLKGGQLAYLVRWRDPITGNQMSRQFAQRRDAERLDLEIKRSRQLGGVGLKLVDPTITVAILHAKWWRLYAEPSLSIRTLTMYSGVWTQHVEPRIGSVPLGRVDAPTLQGLVNDMTDDGVTRAIVTKAISILSSMFRHGIVWGDVATNPARDVIKPKRSAPRAIRPPTPLGVERMRAHLLTNGAVRDATIVVALAYAGCRPGELLAIEWTDLDLQRGRIVIDKALDADGSIKPTKTKQNRVVNVIEPLAEDLRAWHAACGRPSEGLLFSRSDREPFTDTDYRNWRNRQFQKVCEVVGLGRITVYALRHTFVSTMLTGGVNPLQVANEAGHDPQTMWTTYSHFLPGLRNGPLRTPEQLIREARAQAMVEFPSAPVVHLTDADGHEVKQETVCLIEAL